MNYLRFATFISLISIAVLAGVATTDVGSAESDPDPTSNDGVIQNGNVIEGRCGDHLLWKLDASQPHSSEQAYLSIYKEGDQFDSYDMYSYSSDGGPWKQYMDTYTVQWVDIGATSIGENAFRGYTVNGTIVVGQSVRSIGATAFQGCSVTGDGIIRFSHSSTIEYIGVGAFQNCSLNTLDQSATNCSEIQNSAFAGCNVPDIGDVFCHATHVGDYAFLGCTSLTGISLNSVISIGDYAFDYCTGISNVNLPIIKSIGNYAFSDCKNLKTINDPGSEKFLMPDSVEHIGDYSFSGCSSMSFVKISTSVTSIDTGVFQNCVGLYRVVFPDALTSIGDYAFQGCEKLKTNTGSDQITIPDSVESLGDYAFANCSTLKNLHLGTSLRSIGNYSFQDCTGLSSVEFSDDVRSIGDHAFQGCTSLERSTQSVFKIPDSVEYLGNYAFADCTLLRYVELGTGIEAVGSYAFNNCKDLKSISLSNVQSIGDYAFQGCENLQTEGQDPFVISDLVKYLGNYAFDGCKSLRAVTIGNGVTAVSNYAFNNCSGMVSVMLGNVQTVGNYAFAGCSLLEDVTGIAVKSVGHYSFSGALTVSASVLLPSLEIIEPYAFSYCGVESFNSRTVKEIEFYAFRDCPNLKNIYIQSIVENIDPSSFRYCSKLESLYLNPLNETYRTDNNALVDVINKSILFYPQAATAETYVIEDDIESVFSGAFSGNTLLTKVVFGKNLHKIEGNAFENCTGIKKIMMNDRVDYIDIRAFAGCTSIESINIPASLQYLGFGAFEGVEFYDQQGKIIFNHNAAALRGTYFEKKDGRLTLISKSGFAIQLNPMGGSCDFVAIGTDSEGKIGDLPEATYVGKIFIGWFTAQQSGSLVEAGHKFLYNTTIYAHYSAIPAHSITYNLNGGIGTAPVQPDVREGESFHVASCTGYMPGFEFSGWMFNNRVYHPGDSVTMGEASIDFIAIWYSVRFHSVIYDQNGGSELPPVQIDIREGLSFIVQGYSGQMKGQNFGGWASFGKLYQPGEEITMGSADITLVALWAPKPTHTVTYNINGGSGLEPMQTYVQEDTAFTVKQYEGKKSGFHFSGWLYNQMIYSPGQSIIMGQHDIELVAFWASGDRHHVTYDLDGGSGAAPTQEDVAQGQTFVAASCSATKQGQAFQMWSCEGVYYQPGDLIMMGDSDMVLTAIWIQILKHKVVYDANGGQFPVPEQGEVTEGQSFTVQNYMGFREGYNFKGWEHNGKTYVAGSSIVMAKEDIKLTAVWVPIKDSNMDKINLLTIVIVVLLSAVCIVSAIRAFKH